MPPVDAALESFVLQIIGLLVAFVCVAVALVAYVAVRRRRDLQRVATEGRGVRQQGDKLNMKSPGVGSPVQWHQDWAFYPHTNDDILAVGLAIDDTTIENGAT